MFQRGIVWSNSPVGFVFALIAGGLGMAAVATLGIAKSPVGLLASTFLFSFIGFLLWLASCRVPRNTPGCIGIALAIRAETEAERKRIRSDFIAEIAAALKREDVAIPFKVIEIPSYLSPDVNDDKAAIEFLDKSKCQLIIWGGIRTRKQAKEDVYCLRLEGVVTHSMISKEISHALAQEMRQALPKQTEIALANELKGFESASQSTALAAKYIVALAAALSGDLRTSREILEELAEMVKVASKKGKKGSGKLKDTLSKRLAVILPQRLADVCFADYMRLVTKWQTDKSRLELLQEAEVQLEAYLVSFKKFNKEGPEYWVAKALLEVTLRNNLTGAERLLQQCTARAINNPVWRVSLAFVKMLEGYPLEALRLYDAALAFELHIQTIFQVEDYVQWWLSKNQGPIPLYLLSALLNAIAKKDAQLAMQDLDLFEKLADRTTTDKALLDRATSLRVELEARATAQITR
ncbi:MAG: hypothetical protein M1547_03010 [Gammaproteobacteria bacterium]|nr:hypothetical protein [Gammaproteobacteria bacterium]